MASYLAIVVHINGAQNKTNAAAKNPRLGADRDACEMDLRRCFLRRGVEVYPRDRTLRLDAESLMFLE